LDDIADSGRALVRLSSEFEPAMVFVWVRRHTSMLACDAAMSLNDDRWVLFPWESVVCVNEDRLGYQART
jgi:hypoxanthine phosphoribosyltransferase